MIFARVVVTFFNFLGQNWLTINEFGFSLLMEESVILIFIMPDWKNFRFKLNIIIFSGVRLVDQVIELMSCLFFVTIYFFGWLIQDWSISLRRSSGFFVEHRSFNLRSTIDRFNQRLEMSLSVRSSTRSSFSSHFVKFSGNTILMLLIGFSLNLIMVIVIIDWINQSFKSRKSRIAVIIRFFFRNFSQFSGNSISKRFHVWSFILFDWHHFINIVFWMIMWL